MAGRAPRAAVSATAPPVQEEAVVAEALVPETTTAPGLEDDPEFAPKFKTVAARTRVAQRSPFKVLACTWSGMCGRGARL